MPVMKPCVERDCAELVEKGGDPRCPKHRRQHRRRRKAEGSTGARGSTRQWRELRVKVLRRDGYACTYCGSSEDLEIHHMDGDSSNNNLYNLVSVCRRHHQELSERQAADKRKQLRERRQQDES